MRSALLLLIPGLVLARPVIQQVDDGTINWTTREVRVNGVGTPVILSHTGAATPRDPYEQAKDDARVRIARVLEGLPVDHRKASEVAALESIFSSTVRGYRADAPLHFSDGTVHLPATASFAWGPALAGPPVPQPANAPTGLVITLAAPHEPRMRLTLSAPGAPTVVAGLPGDLVGAAGVIWVTEAAEATHLVGPRPVVCTATPGPRAGTLVLDAAGAAALKHPGGVQGGLAIVLPQPKK